MQKDINNLQDFLTSLLQQKEDVQYALNGFILEVEKLKQKYYTDLEYTYLLDDLKQILDSANLQDSFYFLDEIEQELNDLPIKIKKAQDAYKILVNPILKNTPVYFDAANPPDPRDYFIKDGTK